MESISIESMDLRVQEHVVLAKDAIAAESFFYAEEILKQILKNNPGCMAVRRLLYQSARKSYCRKGWLARVSGRMRFVGLLVVCIFKNKRALRWIDQAICCNPGNKWGYYLLIKLGIANGWIDLKVIGYEGLAELFPDDHSISLGLGEVYLDRGEVERALRIGEGLLEKDPSNPDVVGLIRQAALILAKGEKKSIEN